MGFADGKAVGYERRKGNKDNPEMARMMLGPSTALGLRQRRAESRNRFALALP